MEALMYKLKFKTTKTPLLAHDKIFKQNVEYIVNDAFVGQLIHAADIRGVPEATQDIEVEKIDIPEYRGEDLTGKSILFAREGGAGDLMFMQPSMEHLKNKYNCKVYLMTSPQYLSIAKRLPGVDAVYPFPSESMPQVDYILTYINSISYPSVDARTLHAVDLFAKLSHVTLAENEKKHKLIVEPAILKEARAYVRKINTTGAKNIVIQFSAQNMNRSYPIASMLTLIGMLANAGHMLYIIGGKRKYQNDKGEVFLGPECPVNFLDQAGAEIPNIKNLTGKIAWERSLGLIAISDLFVGPDSAGVHIAGALDKKQVALYAPFPAEVRVKYYNKVTAIDPVFVTKYDQGEKVRYLHEGARQTMACNRIPCFVHRSGNCSKFDNETGSACWKTITPDIVFNVIKDILEEDDND